jgi:excisionase family DNA binding protein
MARNPRLEPVGAGRPDFLTVEQAAAILGIGRTTAYAQANRYLATGGAEGIPAIRVGGQLRVPRARLEIWHGGPLTPPAPARPVTLASNDVSRVNAPRTRRTRGGGQSSLPFGA